jgi:hypothetical protein
MKLLLKTLVLILSLVAVQPASAKVVLPDDILDLVNAGVLLKNADAKARILKFYNDQRKLNKKIWGSFKLTEHYAEGFKLIATGSGQTRDRQQFLSDLGFDFRRRVDPKYFAPAD